MREARRAYCPLVLLPRLAGNRIPPWPGMAAILAAVTGQSHNLRQLQPLDQPGYILRQLWMQSAELGENELADKIRSRLRSLSGPCLVPQWTTRRASRALSGELGRLRALVWSVTVLGDGRIVTGGADQRVLVWHPANPGATLIELGRHEGMVRAVAVFGNGQVVTGGDRRVLVWDLADPRVGLVELGRHVGVMRSVALLNDGRVVTGADRWVLVWDPVHPGGPTELGRHRGSVRAVAALSDARVVSGGEDGRVLVWDLADPRANPVELGRHVGTVWSVAVFSDARVVSGGTDGRVLVWDSADPGAAPTEIGRHNGAVRSVAALCNGYVVTGGTDQRVLVWDPAGASGQVNQLSCSVTALAATALNADESNLVIAHGGSGFSFWSFIR